MDAARKLVERQEGTLPQVKIKRKADGSFSIFDWEWSEVELIGYEPQEAVKTVCPS